MSVVTKKVEETNLRIQNREHADRASLNCINIEGLSFRYPSSEQSSLENISISIKAGEYVALLGPNGGGKTTLIKIITGLLKPQKGGLELCCIGSEGLKSHIGYVPQSSGSSHIYFPATVFEVVLSGRTAKKGLFKRLDSNDRLTAEEALKTVGLEKHRDKLITNLSGGERQKVFIARALAGQPAILLLDEPTTDIDTNSRQRFYDLLKDLNKTLNLTIILVSHDTETVSEQAERVIYLDKKVMFDGDSRKFLDQKVHYHA